MTGAPVRVDTSGYFDTRNITPERVLPGGYGGNQQNATLWLWTSGLLTVTSVDTMFIATDRSFSSSGPWVAGTFTNLLGSGPWFKYDFLASADSVRGVPYVRFRVRIDGNSAARYPGARLSISR
jgi:hypothetical protein